MTTILVPRALSGLSPIALNLGELDTAERRIAEVATVTPLKAPELLATFNMAFLEASRYIALLEQEYVQAKRQADRIRSVVLLDKVPQILAAKGLASAKSPAGSEDLRKAVLDGDEEYGQALDRVNVIECYVELLKGKQKGLEMAYTSVKKMLGESTFNYGNRLSAGSEGEATAGQIVGFGKARID